MARKSRKKPEVARLEQQQSWNTAAYLRLSNEQSSIDESDSISSQRLLVKDYLSKQPDMQFTAEYIDDGRTGTNFERPAFRRMINAILDEKINAVVVKDLSRFGRNFEETEEYLLKIFPFLKVRFISINDEFDSKYMEADTIKVGLKNLVNDYYAKDVSHRVGIGIVARREQGIYWGPRPPYGYLIKKEKDLRFLVPDPKTADYVKVIFNMVDEGMSYHSIVKWLEEQEVVPPMRRLYELGLLKNERYKGFTKWYRSTIVNIIRNPVYYGVLPIAKSERSLWKNIQYRKLDPSEWACISNTHEALVEKERFDKVQTNADERIQIAKEMREDAGDEMKEPNLFAYKVFCSHCQKPMTRKYFKTRKEKRSYYFICENEFNKNPEKKCPHSYIRENKLKMSIFEILRKHMEGICDLEALITQQQDSSGSKVKVNYLGQLEELERNIADKNWVKKELYFDWKRKELTEEEYVYMRKENAQKMQELIAQKEQLEEYATDFREEPGKKYPLINQAKAFLDATELDEALINVFIKNIFIYPENRLEVELKTTDVFHDILMLSSRLEEDA